jgi:hypothetical protein
MTAITRMKRISGNFLFPHIWWGGGGRWLWQLGECCEGRKQVRRQRYPPTTGSGHSVGPACYCKDVRQLEYTHFPNAILCIALTFDVHSWQNFATRTTICMLIILSLGLVGLKQATRACNSPSLHVNCGSS